jgi:hypothetical protein
MSDTDSLDDLLDDIDMDNIIDSKQEFSSSIATMNDSGKKIVNEADLDDLLDDFFDEEDTSAPASSTISQKENTAADDDDIDDGDDGGLTAHLQLQKTHDLERALHTIPDLEMKKKWMNILQDDIKLNDSSSPFKHSYSYLECQDSVEHFAVDKSLRNLVLRACSKSKMSDAQAKCLQDVLFHDPILLKKYCKQIVEEKATEIKNDEDFNEDKYPALWKMIV